MTLFLVAAFMTVTGLFITYIAVGIAKSNERRRSEEECDERIRIIRRDLLRNRR